MLFRFIARRKEIVMEQLPISEFKLLKVQEIKDSPCLELMADGSHLCYVILGVEGDMQHRIKGIMSQIDGMRGK